MAVKDVWDTTQVRPTVGYGATTYLIACEQRGAKTCVLVALHQVQTARRRHSPLFPSRSCASCSFLLGV